MPSESTVKSPLMAAWPSTAIRSTSPGPIS